MSENTEYLTEKQLAEIEERLFRASEGPWRAENHGILDSSGYPVVPDEGRTLNADATFIAAARSDVPALVAEVRRLRSLLPTEADAAMLHEVWWDWDSNDGEPATAAHLRELVARIRRAIGEPEQRTTPSAEERPISGEG